MYRELQQRLHPGRLGRGGPEGQDGPGPVVMEPAAPLLPELPEAAQQEDARWREFFVES